MRNCTLVCREWRPRAQFWLFKRFKIRHNLSIQRFLNIKEHADAILARVRVVVVECGNLDSTFQRNNLLTRFATPLTKRVLSLSHLEIRGGRFLRDSGDICIPIHPHALRLCSPFASVTRLVISRIRFKNTADFGHLLVCFGALKDITLSKIFIPQEKDDIVRHNFQKTISNTSTRKTFLLHNLYRFEVRNAALG